MSDKINIEAYFKKYSNLYQFEEGSPEYLIDKEDFKAAIKEIIETVIERCAENAEIHTEFFDEKDNPIYQINRQSILNVKTMINYE